MKKGKKQILPFEAEKQNYLRQILKFVATLFETNFAAYQR
jgi:hypothetical protein